MPYYVVSYDIVDTKLRTKVAKILVDYGVRVQKSVFECRVDEKRFLEMKKKVEEVIDFENDSVRYYTLCKKCIEAIQVSGWGSVLEDEEVYVV